MTSLVAGFEEGPMIWTRVSTFVMIIALATLCLGQDTTSGGPDSIIAGPFGEPRMVMSEGGEWSYPIKMFANSEVETFVPDITSPGWVSWHVSEFRQKGTYFIYLYIYHRKSRNTGRETVYVDTRANTAIVVRPLIAPIRVDISKAPLELSRSIAKITALVTEETGRYKGKTVQEVVEQDEDEAVREMCQQQGGCDPTIVRHPRTPLRLIPGAVPGVNCGIGTNKSCCCASDSTAPNSSASLSVSQTDAITSDHGLYHVGKRVSSPVLLNNVNVGYTDEARRAKYQGVCQVSVIVDAQGNPQNLRVVRGLGMGLNDKALEAVQKYKFKPAMLDGKTPVPVMISVEVNFRLY
jgi:TonB family protein